MGAVAYRVPFGPALWPWLHRAGTTWAGPAGAGGVLAPSARADLEESLAWELAEAAAPVLLLGFLTHPGRTGLSPASTVDYDRYLTHLTTGRLGSELRAYPELGRVLDGVVADWSAAVEGLVRDLRADASLVRSRFGVRYPVLRVLPLGGSAHGLRAAGGCAVVHKSRAGDMDVAFGRLLAATRAWPGLDEGGPAPEGPATVDRGDHCWTSFVPAEGTVLPLPGYWYRVGVLLCLVHALGGGDVHAGNVRTLGGRPVVVDAEVLLRPRRAGTEDVRPDVLSTGWLPTPTEAERCGLVVAAHDARGSRWVAPCTDGMRRATLRSPLRGISAAVATCFDRLRTSGGLDALVRGFRATYAAVLQHGLPLDVFDGCRPRALLRSSCEYQEAVALSLTPSAMTSSRAREEVLRRLSDKVPPVLAGQPVIAGALAEVELRSMRHREVPRLTVPVDGHELWADDQLLGRVFDRSPRERATQFLRVMSEQDCRDQCHVVIDVVGAAASGELRSRAWDLRPTTDVDLAAV